jgi:CIC family chloride channel protein
VITGLLRGGYALSLIALLLFAKPIATAASVGSGSPGGVFTPSLFLGAALGACMGGLFGRLLPGHVAPLGAYALVGMAAVVAATTHAPLMAAVLVFELSGDYAIVLPLLIATSLGTGVARILDPRSIYTAELARRGLRWEVTMAGRRIARDTPDHSEGP